MQIASIIASNAPGVGTEPNPTQHIYTVLEYLDFESTSGERYEYYKGKIKLMAGGSIAHNRIARNILTELESSFKNMPEFEAFGSDQKIFLPEYDYYVYPDAVVVAEGPLLTEDVSHAIINPLLVIEVLSDSTERHDRGQKFIEYRSLPSFKEYVLIRQDKPTVVSFYKSQPGVWLEEEFKEMESEVYFKSIDLRVAMRLIYRKVELK